jgi:O-antigen ligase
MIDVIFLAALFALLIQNSVPALAAAGVLICCVRGFAGWLADKVKFRKLEFAIVLFFVYWLANYFWSTRSLANLFSFSFLRRDGALLVSYPAFFFLLHWRLRLKYFRFFWYFFLTCLSLMAVCGIAALSNLPYTASLQSLRLVGVESEFAGSRLFYAWYQAHDTAAGVYAIASLLLAALLLEGKLGRRSRIYVWMMFVSCLAGLAFTFGRSGYLAFVAGGLILLPLRELRKAFKIALLLAVPALVLVLGNSTLLDRVDTITDPNWGTNATRFMLWRDALHDFSLSPIVGIGFGRYNDLERQFKGVPGVVDVAVEGRIINNSTTAHDSYLHFLAEGGIVGLTVSLYVWWCAWAELSFFLRRFPKSKYHAFQFGARACLAGIAVHSLTDHALGSGSIVLMLMSVIGLTLAASRQEWSEARGRNDLLFRDAGRARARSLGMAKPLPVMKFRAVPNLPADS